MRVAVLDRGGLAVFQGGHYDPHRNEAVFQFCRGDEIPVVVEYGSAPTSPSVVASGMTAGSAAVSGNKVSLSLSGISPGGYLDLTATADGSDRVIRLRAGPTQTLPDGYETDGGAFVPEVDYIELYEEARDT